MSKPAYCCQQCGAAIGYLGRFFQFLRIRMHRCMPKQDVILVDREGVAYKPERKVVLRAKGTP